MTERATGRIRSASRWAVLGATIAVMSAASGAQAAIFLDPQSVFLDRVGDFEARLFWTFPAAGDDTAGPFTGACGEGKKCWTLQSVESNAPRGGPPTKRDLIAVPQHTPGERLVDPGHGPNAANGILGFFDVQRPPAGKPVYASANRVAHGAHSDYFTGVLKTHPMNDFRITITGKHEGALNPFQASFTNFAGVPLTGYYQASYGLVTPKNPIPDVGPQIPFDTVQPGTAAKSATLGKKDGKDPSDYVVVASGSARTETTLAFLGTVGDDPAITELELAPLTEMLAPDGFLVPMLREITATVDLFVFVDLLQWLAAEGAFSPLQEYDISSGTSTLLPGFFVSTTPVAVGLDGSFLGTPYFGRAVAAGGIDGHALPAPPTLALVAVAALAAALAARHPYGRRSATMTSRPGAAGTPGPVADKRWLC
jgi:hypothetical protein